MIKLSSVSKLFLLAIGLALIALSVWIAKRRSVPLPPEWREPVTGMEFRLIPAGSFPMGSPPTEAEREPQETYHRADVSRAFYLGKYEVTQGEWQQVMGTNPSHFSDCGPRCPVERVNFYQVQDFIARLQKLSGRKRFRLPTEAEWEYACRAGTTAPFNTGATLSTEQANYNGEYPYDGQPRGNNRQRTLPTNAFSKKWDNLNYSYALHFFYYNFMRVHSTLRVTPAMESKLTDHIWTWEEVIAAPLI